MSSDLVGHLVQLVRKDLLVKMGHWDWEVLQVLEDYQVDLVQLDVLDHQALMVKKARKEQRGQPVQKEKKELWCVYYFIIPLSVRYSLLCQEMVLLCHYFLD